MIRDPYAVYAKRVLGLRRLDEPGATVDARTRGDALHKVVERFVDETKDAWLAAGDADRLFERIAEETLSRIAAPPAATAAWAARLARVRGWFVAEEAKRRAAGRPLGVEIKGAATVATAGGAFEIKGRADRIDALGGGGLAIYDYKAGQTPSDRQVARFAKQLPLLALIAEAGGFDGVAADRAAKLAYLSLSGEGEGGRERPARPDEDAAAGLARLIEAFEDEARAYFPRAVPETMDFASDYDHLSRYGEWDDRSADP
ncbi:MAG: PD-(D/E)XK nuclease family protein [Pseudomonadota bacterium]